MEQMEPIALIDDLFTHLTPFLTEAQATNTTQAAYRTIIVQVNPYLALDIFYRDQAGAVLGQFRGIPTRPFAESVGRLVNAGLAQLSPDAITQTLALMEAGLSLCLYVDELRRVGALLQPVEGEPVFLFGLSEEITVH